MKHFKAVYPGSFDPVTYGHLDMISRASKIFDELIIVVGENPKKTYLFNREERVTLLRKAISNYEEKLDNVHVEYFDGLLVNYCRKIKTNIILRGMRAITDFESEFQMALANLDMAPNIETFFMITKPRSMPISSSLVREIASFGGDVSKYAPQVVNNALKKKHSN
jgi:pantetheine-phosphate adenylyltransferase